MENVITMKYRKTEELNQRAIKVLESNQILQKYTQLRKGGKQFINKAIRINQDGKPFTVSDFSEIKKSMRKKYVFQLKHAGLIETMAVSGYAYYRVVGFRLSNFWEKVTKNPMGVTIEDKTLQEEIFEILGEYFEDLDSPALHNIRLHFHDDFIYEVIKRKFEKEKPYNIEFNESNKSFSIIPTIFGIDDFEAKIILTRTKLVQIIIKNTFKPVVVDETGLIELVLFLGEIRYFLCKYSSDIPQVLEWLFVRADFGRDCKKPLNKLFPTMQFKHISGALLRVYSKKWKDGSRRLRVEKIISPNKSMKNFITDVLDEPRLD